MLWKKEKRVSSDKALFTKMYVFSALIIQRFGAVACVPADAGIRFIKMS